MGEFESDDWMIDEALVEGFPLVGVLDRFFVANPGKAETLDDDADSLVVEIGHDDCPSVRELSKAERSEKGKYL